ncbi:MAG: hypothetical protein ACRDG9_13140, partial [Actinomycetota bacterium]
MGAGREHVTHARLDVPVIAEATHSHAKRRDNLPLIGGVTPGQADRPNPSRFARNLVRMMRVSDNGQVLAAR